MAYELPKLPYAYNALEPHIDETTMTIHHTKHHQAYIDKVNAALKGTEWEGKPIEEVVANLDSLPAEIKEAVRNNGGGHINHSFFWEILAPAGEGGKPSDALITKMKEDFEGDENNCKKEFANAAATRFGSGWAWLVVTKDKKLKIYSTANQDSPVTNGDTPLIGLDVWEHAYYLNYQNKRPAYVEAFEKIINWDKVNALFEKAME